MDKLTNKERAAVIGQKLARRFFATRGSGRNVEVHLREEELAALIGLGAELGFEEGKKHR